MDNFFNMFSEYGGKKEKGNEDSHEVALTKDNVKQAWGGVLHLNITFLGKRGNFFPGIFRPVCIIY